MQPAVCGQQHPPCGTWHTAGRSARPRPRRARWGLCSGAGLRREGRGSVRQWTTSAGNERQMPAAASCPARPSLGPALRNKPGSWFVNSLRASTVHPLRSQCPTQPPMPRPAPTHWHRRWTPPTAAHICDTFRGTRRAAPRRSRARGSAPARRACAACMRTGASHPAAPSKLPPAACPP